MEIGNKKAKYAVQVYTKAYASKWTATVYCDTEEEYNKLLDDNCNEIHDKGYISTNISNDFDISDCEIDEIKFDEEKQYSLNSDNQ